MSTDTPFGNPGADDDKVFKLPEESDEALVNDAEPTKSQFYIADGDHVARVIEIEEATSKAGNDMWVWTFAIDRGEYEGREVRTFTALTPKAMFKLREVVEALGLWAPPKDGNKKKPLEFSVAEAMGRRAVLEISMVEYNGRANPQVDKVKPLEGGPGPGGSATAPSDDIPF